jgi:hypothetical protein
MPAPERLREFAWLNCVLAIGAWQPCSPTSHDFPAAFRRQKTSALDGVPGFNSLKSALHGKS